GQLAGRRLVADGAEQARRRLGYGLPGRLPPDELGLEPLPGLDQRDRRVRRPAPGGRTPPGPNAAGEDDQWEECEVCLFHGSGAGVGWALLDLDAVTYHPAAVVPVWRVVFGGRCLELRCSQE